MDSPASSRLLLALCAVAALSARPAAADQGDDLARLRDAAAQQRRDLEQTEARIRAMEQKSGDPAAQESGSAAVRADAVQASPLLQLKRNWSQIEKGTPQERVQALLGAPEKVLRIDGAPVWYYAYPGIGPGSVFFNANGKVSSLQAPSFGWW